MPNISEKLRNLLSTPKSNIPSISDERAEKAYEVHAQIVELQERLAGLLSGLHERVAEIYTEARESGEVTKSVDVGRVRFTRRNPSSAISCEKAEPLKRLLGSQLFDALFQRRTKTTIKEDLLPELLEKLGADATVYLEQTQVFETKGLIENIVKIWRGLSPARRELARSLELELVGKPSVIFQKKEKE